MFHVYQNSAHGGEFSYSKEIYNTSIFRQKTLYRVSPMGMTDRDDLTRRSYNETSNCTLTGEFVHWD